MSEQIDSRSLSSPTAASARAATEAAGVVVPAVALGGRLNLPALRQWVLDHDDSWLFLGLYIGLAVVLSIWISLFWLVAVVAAHFALELVRQQHLHRGGYRGVVLEALWELKLDVALVLFALALTLYMELVLGIVGLQSAARIGAVSRTAARVGAWERTLRGVLLSADDAAQVARAVAMRRSRARCQVVEAEVAQAPQESTRARDPRWGSWTGQWGTGDWIAVALTLVCLGLVAGAPWLTGHSYETAFTTILVELRPLP